MKFSIIFPTQDRAKLLAVAVKYAMQLDHPNFEVIVSDNSTTDVLRSMNAEALREYDGASNFRLIRPNRVLSPPEHFEFALSFATGDYVSYLTDKMVVLPYALMNAEAAIRASGADIVNWAGAPYLIQDPRIPSGAGTLVEEFEFLSGPPSAYDPIAALQFKASGIVPRDKQSTRDYVLGKLVFGCYSRRLIERIRARSGTMFGGATHDYSAMIQALSLASSCVILNTYAKLFISLPRAQSLGSATATEPQRALQYYKTFSDPDLVLASLLVPQVYASPHNMVAHDYQKFLPMYDNCHLFSEANWLSAIYSDLTDRSKLWLNEQEKKAQLSIFIRHVSKVGRLLPFGKKRLEHQIKLLADFVSESRMGLRYRSTFGKFQPPSAQTFAASNLEEAVRHVASQRQSGANA